MEAKKTLSKGRSRGIFTEEFKRDAAFQVPLSVADRLQEFMPTLQPFDRHDSCERQRGTAKAERSRALAPRPHQCQMLRQMRQMLEQVDAGR